MTLTLPWIIVEVSIDSRFTGLISQKDAIAFQDFYQSLLGNSILYYYSYPKNQRQSDLA